MLNILQDWVEMRYELSRTGYKYHNLLSTYSYLYIIVRHHQHQKVTNCLRTYIALIAIVNHYKSFEWLPWPELNVLCGWRYFVCIVLCNKYFISRVIQTGIWNIPTCKWNNNVSALKRIEDLVDAVWAYITSLTLPLVIEMPYKARKLCSHVHM